ncbi:MAG: FAD-dependent oxidoreductase [Spirochaetes bacterium]|jgi:NADH-quinone oxidoreductase subunit F|nr:FAD-dependent oxidoreductase [Spirochaetota bacterium]
MIKNLKDLEKYKIPTKDSVQIRICTGASCIASGALEIKEAFIDECKKMSINPTITCTGCLGPCSRGPVIVIDPGGFIYEGLTKADITEIVKEHIIDGKPIARLARKEEGSTEVLYKLEEIPFFSLQKKIALSRCGQIDPGDITDTFRHGGYKALAEILQENSSTKVIETLKESGIRGRGGAGFPTWLKWKLTKDSPDHENGIKYVLCNADEGDPGAFMDRSILEGDPHSVIEGMIIAGFTVGASQGFVYVRAEYPLAVARLEHAIKQARENGLLGNNILGSGLSFDIGIRKGSGAFVCGEETALIASIEGKRGEPRPRPPFPAQKGLWGSPTLLNNVETYANVTALFRIGKAEYKKHGTKKSPGTKVFALAGNVRNTGLVEVPIGTPLGDLIYDIGGGITNDKQFKAAQVGGPSGGCIPREYLNVPMDYESLKELGAIMGSGGLIVMDEDTCMVDVARFFLEFVQEESCGKCVPCRVGTKRMLEIIDRICVGNGSLGDLDLLEELGQNIQDTALCGLGQTAPNPVLSTLRHFRHEYIAHIVDKKCPAGVCAEIVRAPCQSACPAGVDVPGFIALTGERRYAEALQAHRNRNPFAAVCARVCFHTCEDRCRRSTIDEPVNIRGIKRFLTDQEIVIQTPEVRDNPVNAEKKIAIIGAGPAGLSCAYFLARLGYRPFVFEASERPGGMLNQTIPAYRLPREILAREIRMIEGLGVTIKTGKVLGRDFTLDSLRDEGWDAIFVGIGAPECMPLGLPGEKLNGVVQAIDFLRTYNTRGSVAVGKKVVVVGGGNAAIDTARCAIRLGAEKVTVIYRRTKEQMPAYDEEIEEALHEGVDLLTLLQPTEIIDDGKGNTTGIAVLAMNLGDYDRSGRRSSKPSDKKLQIIPCDQIIVAIGQLLHADQYTGTSGITTTSKGFFCADARSGATSVPGVFAGGDAVTGPASVVEAIGAGERAAVGIDAHLTGEHHAFWRVSQETDVSYDPDADPAPYQRERQPLIDVSRRRYNFEEVEKSWVENSAVRQCNRCLRCDYGKPAVYEPGYEGASLCSK